MAEDWTDPVCATVPVKIQPYEPPTLKIGKPDGELLIEITPGGRVVYGPNYTPDEAARTFWEAMATYVPPCPNCGGPLLKGNSNG